MSAIPPMIAALELRNVQAWYGQQRVLHGIDLRVDQGEVVALLGPGGCGRTSVLRAIQGLTDSCTGSIRIGSAESVGKLTTRAVVQSIFLVIVLDAIFSIIFSFIGI